MRKISNFWTALFFILLIYIALRDRQYAKQKKEKAEKVQDLNFSEQLEFEKQELKTKPFIKKV